MPCSHIFFIFMLIMLWIFSAHLPFPLVHLFCSYLCRNQAISAPPAHKHNERERTLCYSTATALATDYSIPGKEQGPSGEQKCSLPP